MNTEGLWGISDEHIDFESLEKPVHKLFVKPFTHLKEQAKLAGFDLCIASGFRGFERQLEIWNAKAQGRRKVLDSKGQVIERGNLSNTQLMFAILRWSALPGASRHHWGSDVDIYDARAISPKDLQLVADEYQACGPCAALYRWLQSRATSDQFYWPYSQDCGGVAPEPWHLSYRPLSQDFEQQLTVDGIAKIIAAADIELKKEILQNVDTIFMKYIKNVSDI